MGQVDKNDIPMQKQCCREFVECQSNWELVKEVYEKGVSGYKKSVEERDAIQEIQQYAIEAKFDILLVYMFDRLGRRDDETPFVVEWFVEQGIEVWSVMEGQQRFDSHVDKLLNYIRYWQASGESIKTSMCVKTRLEQLTESGHYTGGSVPYGYHIEKLGRTNKRNKEVYDLVIDEDAAQIVRLIFYKYVNEGFGAQRISRYLMEMNIRRADGSDFPNTSIISIEKAKELGDYQAETIRVIRGESRLDSDLLNELVSKAKKEISEPSSAVELAKQDLNERMGSAKQEQKEFEKLQSWADLYDNCTFAAKKMIVSQFINAVYVYRDYTIEVEFNVSFDEFKALSANCTNEGNEKATVYPVSKEKDRLAI